MQVPQEAEALMVQLALLVLWVLGAQRVLPELSEKKDLKGIRGKQVIQVLLVLPGT